MVAAGFLDFPFASSAVFAAARFELEVMTKRRRAGAVFAPAFGATLLLRLRDGLLAADVFLFSIKYKTRIIRFSSEKYGNFRPANAAAPDKCAFTQSTSGDCDQKTDAPRY